MIHPRQYRREARRLGAPIARTGAPHRLYFTSVRWYIWLERAIACCARLSAWLAVASARAATAQASQGGGGAAQAPSSNSGVPSASTRATVTEPFPKSLVIFASSSAKLSLPDGERSLGLRPKPLSHYQPAKDRKSTRLNSSHMSISYAVFCLKKKKTKY